MCEKDRELCGFQFKAGDVAAIDVFAMHNSGDYWDQPEKFRPERFLAKDFKIENDDSKVFMPFGSGPRACLASRLVFVEASFARPGGIELRYLPV